MFIEIPIVVKHVAGAQGSAWKLVRCAHCQRHYAYVVELETTGDVHGVLFVDGEACARQAQANADRNLAKLAGNAVLPVPCPHCGSYQDDMVRLLKEERSSSVPLIAGLTIAGLSLVPLAFSFPFNWIVTALGVVGGLFLAGYGDYAQDHYDPNAGDPEPRKARGRRLAVSDEELAELIQLLESKSDHRDQAKQHLLVERRSQKTD